MEKDSVYVGSEIKNNIDIAIQLSMFDEDKKDYDIILNVKTRLYEKFVIFE